ncbi:lipopolysaccharide biosynthesis protein [Fischerella sp. PCC 9605]|uniref:lipopolysaccharide biosynthesis protein n=1 Tax=Fischerella sp. PCC 9605 TaxID=1173024 RepID=UPI001E2E93A6|nr:oligosaccharide flippase family protein [Fischerella sp. PCC 9605]
MIKRWLANSIFLRRIIKNVTWLLGGRVITGLTSLVYLSTVTHQLGVTGFGTLVLIQTYIQIVVDLTTFQSSQAVIRYGAICLEQKNKVALQQLLKFTTLLDLVGVLVGLAIAVIIAPYLGSYIGWNQTLITQVQWCSLIILFTTTATPKGLLQLYNRFDWLAFQITIPTMISMLGAMVAAILNAPLWGYLVVWFIAQASGGLLLFLVGWREAWKRGLLKNINWSLMNLSQSHPGLLKFCIVSNLDSSLPMVMRQASPLVVGIFATPSAAGLFQVSYELSTPLKDIAQILTQSIYPELARLESQEKWRLFAILLLKSTAIAISIGVIIFIISVCLGQIVLKFAFGETFISAYGSLVLLVVAEIFTMGNCALEPAFYAIGKPSFPLRVNAIAILGVYLPLLLVLTKFFGIVGTGIATLSSTALILIFNSLLIWPQLRRR